MRTVKIQDLPIATSVAPTDELLVVQGGELKRATVSTVVVLPDVSSPSSSSPSVSSSASVSTSSNSSSISSSPSSPSSPSSSSSASSAGSSSASASSSPSASASSSPSASASASASGSSSPSASGSSSCVQDPTYALPTGQNPPPNGWGWEEFTLNLYVEWVGASTPNYTQGEVYHADKYRPPWGSSFDGNIRIKDNSDVYGWVGHNRGTDWEILDCG